MITLTLPHRPLSSAVREAGDGFCWWYVDIVDDAGNGVVFIVAFGLPFLPADARTPSINLAVYRDGRQIFYALQELAPDDAHCSFDGGDEVFVFGRTGLVVRRAHGRVVVEANVDIEVDGVSCARGTIVVRGVARQGGGDGEGGDCVHDWSPQTGPASGSARLTLDGEDVVVDGRGYHDRNGSTVPLSALGIDHWWWCRSCADDDERIVYALWPADGGAPHVIGVRVDAAGRTQRREDLQLNVKQQHSTAFGVRVFDHVVVVDNDGENFVEVKARAVVESGPFYVRGLFTGGGVFEHVLPLRIDLPQHRPLVAMRVARETAPSSLWLPLFCGNARSRWRRLWAFWRRRFALWSRSTRRTA